jgi:hypothetical protein
MMENFTSCMNSAYGDIKFGAIHGLTPYYKPLNQLFRYTLCPKTGDSDNISNISKNLLARMAPTRMSLASLTSFGIKSSSALFHQRKAVITHHTSFPWSKK